MKLPIEEWLYEESYEEKLKNLFFELENVLSKKGLLRNDFIKYRNYNILMFYYMKCK